MVKVKCYQAFLSIEHVGVPLHAFGFFLKCPCKSPQLLQPLNCKLSHLNLHSDTTAKTIKKIEQ